MTSGSAILAELRARPEPAPTVSEAWLLVALGDADGAFELLGRAEDEREPFLPFTALPGFDPLRTDSRFFSREDGAFHGVPFVIGQTLAHYRIPGATIASKTFLRNRGSLQRFN